MRNLQTQLSKKYFFRRLRLRDREPYQIGKAIHNQKAKSFFNVLPGWFFKIKWYTIRNHGCTYKFVMTIKISCYEGKQDDNKISESLHGFLLYHSVPTYPLERGFQPIQQPADPISGADSICLFAALPLYAFSAGFWILSLLHHLHIFRMVSCTAQQKRILLLLTVLGFLLFNKRLIWSIQAPIKAVMLPDGTQWIGCTILLKITVLESFINCFFDIWILNFLLH